MERYEIAEILNHIGLLLELKGETFFKSKAYYDAARAIELMEEDISVLVRENRLKNKKGFGEALTKKLTELVETGRLEYYEKLKSEIPSGLMEMLRIPGLGAKKIKTIYHELGIASIDDLKEACIQNKLSVLAGFGDKTQKKILEGIESLNKYYGHYYYYQAEAAANEIVDDIAESGLVQRCSIAGSLRRRKEIVKDIDIIASSKDMAAVIDFFTEHRLVVKVNAKGSTKASVTLKEGINADLRVVTDEQYPYALHHFTGSREHNTAMRHMARQINLKMNEYGLFRDSQNIACNSEEEIFKQLGMAYIPPELRENNGEIEAALESRLPVLVEPEDIKGIIHVHSNYSDGTAAIEELVKGCIQRGYSYLGISDHSKSAYYAGGLNADQIKRQHEEIDRINEAYPMFKVFKGIELDILPNGDIDYDDEILEYFDFTIASVHSSFKMDEDKMTERIVKAVSNKYVTILGHPTGRLLLSREGYKVNMPEIIKAASKENKVLEINANPHRLDLDWRLIKPAKEQGCLFAVAPDAHSIAGIDDVIYGVYTARKGWLRKEDIINTADARWLDMYFRSKADR